MTREYRADANRQRLTTDPDFSRAVVEARQGGLSFGEAVRAVLNLKTPAESTAAARATPEEINLLLRRWAIAVLRYYEGNKDFDVPLDELLDWVCMYAEPVEFVEWVTKRFPQPD